MTEAQASIHEEVREWFTAQITGKKAIRLPALAAAAVKHFGRNLDFLRRFADAYLYAVLYEAGLKFLSQHRGPLSLAFTGGKLGAVAESIWGRWESHLEHAGDQYIPLPELTRSLARVAIAERQARADVEGRMAAFLERLTVPLKRNQRVRDYWQPAQIQEVYDEVNGKKEAA